MKKSIKKLATVAATVAMCCSLVIPVSVKAEENSCPPHDFEYETREFRGGTYEHEYLYSRTKEPDGTITYDYRICIVDIMVTKTQKVCQNKGCDVVEDTKYVENHIHRSDCGQN